MKKVTKILFSTDNRDDHLEVKLNGDERYVLFVDVDDDNNTILAIERHEIPALVQRLSKLHTCSNEEADAAYAEPETVGTSNGDGLRFTFK